MSSPPLSPLLFSARVLNWFDQFGRKNLPWQKDISPYRVWVSEIMLQQTQVTTVIPYYQRFMVSFPKVKDLAEATQDEVLSHWSGLGYYARGRNLHKAAQHVMSDFKGVFPCDMESLESLPGVGRSTAAAISSIACEKPEPILDGNVKRVLARHQAVEGWPGKLPVQKQLWAVAEGFMPEHSSAQYTQAMMDLGATICTRSKPACDRCPLSSDCLAYQQGIPTHYPFPKPKKTKPIHQRQFLLLYDADTSLMLQKRPAAGLWGGLWSLPELEMDENRKQALREKWALKLNSERELPSFKHSFSHYDLEILPVLIEVESAADLIKEMASNEAVWYNTATQLPGGVPAPVAMLIEQFQVELLSAR